MKEFLKRNNQSIIVGLLSSAIFLYFLQPILEYIARGVFRVGSFVGANYVDEIFAQAAHLELHDYAFLIFSYPVVFVGVLSLFGVFMIWSRKLIIKKHEKNRTKIRKEISITKKILVTLLLSAVSVITLASIGTRFYQLSIISSFKQHIRILAPYITDQEEEEIISLWSSMENSSDYDELNLRLLKYGNKFKVKLPENRLYAWNSI